MRDARESQIKKKCVIDGNISIDNMWPKRGYFSIGSLDEFLWSLSK